VLEIQILTQYVGVKWAVALKRIFRAQVQSASTWKEPKPTISDRISAERWNFYTSFMEPSSYIEELRNTWVNEFLCIALPSKEGEYFGGVC
jgi:hypothetical protein